MTDPAELALGRARERGEYPAGYGDATSSSHPDADMGRASIRMPRGRRPSLQQRGDTYLPYEYDRPPKVDLVGLRTAGLDETQKDDLLDELLEGHNTHTVRTRDIELQNDTVDLENKKRFSNLGYSLAKWAGILFLAVIAMFVGLAVYATIFDKPMLETGLFSAFLNTFVEMAKIIFSVF